MKGGPLSSLLAPIICFASKIVDFGENIVNVFQKGTPGPPPPPPGSSTGCEIAVYIGVPVLITLVCLCAIGVAVGYVLKNVLMAKQIFAPIAGGNAGGSVLGMLGVPGGAGGGVDLSIAAGMAEKTGFLPPGSLAMMNLISQGKGTPGSKVDKMNEHLFNNANTDDIFDLMDQMNDDYTTRQKEKADSDALAKKKKAEDDAIAKLKKKESVKTK